MVSAVRLTGVRCNKEPRIKYGWPIQRTGALEIGPAGPPDGPIGEASGWWVRLEAFDTLGLANVGDDCRHVVWT